MKHESDPPQTSTRAAPDSNSQTAEAGLESRRQKIVTLASIVFLFLASVGFAYIARPILIPILLALVLAITLKAPTRWLQQFHLPVVIAAGTVVVTFLAFLLFATLYMGRPAVEWLQEAPTHLPSIRAKLQRILSPAARLTEAASSVSTLSSNPQGSLQPQSVKVQDNKVASTVFNWTGSLLASSVETIALLFLFLTSGDRLLHYGIQTLPKGRDKKRILEMCREIENRISTYLFSVACINSGVGCCVGLAFYGIGLPNALMWGGVAAFANFIPIAGPIITLSAVGATSLLVNDTFSHALIPVGTYLVIHLLESYVVTPLILGRHFSISPLVLFLMLMFCSWIWGVVGALLSVPLLVAIRVVFERLSILPSVAQWLTLGSDSRASHTSNHLSIETPVSAGRSLRHAVHKSST